MNLHSADVLTHLRRFLDRRQAPRRVEGKPQAEADEVSALAATVERHAPRGADALAAWWPRFEVALGEVGTGLWPTEREIRDASQVANRDRPKIQYAAFDQFEINGRRMAAREPVGEFYLYGRDACELIRRGLVDEPTMRAYRSWAFFSRKELYGEAAALAWEAAAKERHEAAKLALRDTARRHHDVRIPDISSPAQGFEI